MPFIASCKNDFLWQLFYIIMMKSFNSDSHSETSAFKKFERNSYKYYPRFSKIHKVAYEALNEAFVLLCNCMSNLKHFLTINSNLLENFNVSQLAMSEKNLATTLCSETTKPENVFDEIKTIRKAKIMK